MVLIAVAVVTSLLLCVVASRTLVSVLVPILRSRRGRDFTILAVTLLGAHAAAPRDVRGARARTVTTSTKRSWRSRDRVRLTPFAWGGTAVADASRGHDRGRDRIPRRDRRDDRGTALGLVARARARAHELRRAGHRAPRDAPSGERADPALAPVPPAQPHRRGRREGPPLLRARSAPARAAHRRARWCRRSRSSPRSARARPDPASTTLLALVAVLPAAGLTLNQFGLDGAPLWATIAAGNDPRADLTGKNLASMLVMVPLATVSTFVCAAFTHGWAYVPLTLGLAPAIFGVLLGVGDVMSVRVPYAMPDRRNPLAFNPGQGCATLLAGFGALAVRGRAPDTGRRAGVRVDVDPVAGRRDRRHRGRGERVRRADLGVGSQHRVAGRVVAAPRAARRGVAAPSGLSATLRRASQSPCTAGTNRARYDVRCT